MKEIWVGSLLYPGYEASSHGRIRSVGREISQKSRCGKTYSRFMKGAVLAPVANPRGYFTARARRVDRKYEMMVHRIVYEIFHGDISAGLVIDHKNGVKTDNRPTNLEACTQKENSRRARQMGLIPPRGSSRKPNGQFDFEGHQK